MTDTPGGGDKGPRWLLVLSLILNAVLGVATGWATYSKTQAETDKMRLEQQLQLRANLPDIATLHILAELGALQGFLESRDPLPFTVDIRHFTIYGNAGFQRLEAELAELRHGRPRRGVMTFLVLVNGAAARAEELTVHYDGGKALVLGSLDGKSAILVPVSFKPDRAEESIFLAAPERVSYAARIGALRQEASQQIVRLQNPRWAPALGSLNGVSIGRAQDGDGGLIGPPEFPK